MQSPKMTARATPFSAETLRPPIVRQSRFGIGRPTGDIAAVAGVTGPGDRTRQISRSPQATWDERPVYKSMLVVCARSNTCAVCTKLDPGQGTRMGLQPSSIVRRSIPLAPWRRRHCQRKQQQPSLAGLLPYLDVSSLNSAVAYATALFALRRKEARRAVCLTSAASWQRS
jgi:hypothetical protein